jgi:hypothetical protein
MSINEIETARANLKALQLAHRNHHEDVRVMRSVIAEAESAVDACKQELGEIAKAETVADRDRVERLKSGGGAITAVGAERRAAVERQNELRDDLTAAQASLDLLGEELATETARSEKLDDELVWATEKLFVLELDETAAAINGAIQRLRDEWLEIRAITDNATVPEWRQLHGYPQPVRASRGLKYGRPMQILLESTIAQNTVFDKAKFEANWSKWSGYFSALKANADATMPALGST